MGIPNLSNPNPGKVNSVALAKIPIGAVKKATLYYLISISAALGWD